MSYMSARRRMLMAMMAQSTPEPTPEPLIIYELPNLELTNGTMEYIFVSFNSIKNSDVGMLVIPQNPESSDYASKLTISGIDATGYSKLIMEYKCGDSIADDGVLYNGEDSEVYMGWGYSANDIDTVSGIHLVDYAEKHMPEDFSTGGTAEFNIEGVNGELYIGAYSGGYSGLIWPYILFTSIRLE